MADLRGFQTFNTLDLSSLPHSWNSSAGILLPEGSGAASWPRGLLRDLRGRNTWEELWEWELGLFGKNIRVFHAVSRNSG